MVRKPVSPGADRLALHVHDARGDAGKRERGGAGLGGSGAGERRNQNRAGFGLPPGVHNGAAIFSDGLEIPFPGRGIDGLADRAKKAQAADVVRVDPVRAPGHEGAHGRGGAIENRDLVALDDFPEAVAARLIGRAFVHHDARAVRERPVDDVAVAGDPADVGGAPVDVVVAEIEDELRGPHALQEIAGGSVQHAFGFAGGAAGVEDVERMLGIEGKRGAILRGAFFEIVPPVVASLAPGDIFAGAAHDDGFFDGGAIVHGGVGGFLERNDFAAAEAAVGGDEDFGFGVGDAVGQRRGAESAENHGMDRADPRAGQHGDEQLGNHGHVDGYAVAGVHAERFQRVRELADALVEFGVGELKRGAVLGFPKERGLIGVFFEMAVEAVVGDVELAAGEPFGVREVPFEDAVRRLEPIEHLRLLGPEADGVFLGVVVHLAVLVERANAGALGEFLGRGNRLLFENVRVEFQHGFLPRWSGRRMAAHTLMGAWGVGQGAASWGNGSV